MRRTWGFDGHAQNFEEILLEGSNGGEVMEGEAVKAGESVRMEVPIGGEEEGEGEN